MDKKREILKEIRKNLIDVLSYFEDGRRVTERTKNSLLRKSEDGDITRVRGGLFRISLDSKDLFLECHKLLTELDEMLGVTYDDYGIEHWTD